MPTARERVRAELTAEITDAARRQLAEVGAAALSLRAVARELGMVSSAVYRYFPSRDDLLTRLIIDGYDDLGAAAEAADDPVGRARRALAGGLPRGPRRGRWRIRTSTRCSTARPCPATRPRRTRCRPRRGSASSSGRILGRGRPQRRAARRRPGERDPGLVSDDAVAVLGGDHPALDETVRVRALLAWSALFGTISFELFGHFVGSVEDGDRYFDRVMADLAHLIGF